MWKVAEVSFGVLEKTLNTISDGGGYIKTVIDGSGSRKDHVVIIWETPPEPVATDDADDADDADTAEKTPSAKKRK